MARTHKNSHNIWMPYLNVKKPILWEAIYLITYTPLWLILKKNMLYNICYMLSLPWKGENMWQTDTFFNFTDHAWGLIKRVWITWVLSIGWCTYKQTDVVRLSENIDILYTKCWIFLSCYHNEQPLVSLLAHCFNTRNFCDTNYLITFLDAVI